MPIYALLATTAKRRVTKVSTALIASVAVLLLQAATLGGADPLPPITTAWLQTCAYAPGRVLLRQLPAKGQVVILSSGVSGAFGSQPLFESSSVVQYTLYYASGPVTVTGLSGWSEHITVTLIEDLAQPFFDGAASPRTASTSPIRVTLRNRHTFVSRYGCSSPADSNADATSVGNAYAAEAILASGPAAMAPGEKANAWIEVRNVGAVAWARGTGNGSVLLATDRPPDRASSFYVQGEWISPNRLATVNTLPVWPREVTLFPFSLGAPSAQGTYAEYFRPVVEGFTWFNDIGVWLSIRVQVVRLTGLQNEVYLPILSSAARGW